MSCELPEAVTAWGANQAGAAAGFKSLNDGVGMVPIFP